MLELISQVKKKTEVFCTQVSDIECRIYKIILLTNNYTNKIIKEINKNLNIVKLQFSVVALPLVQQKIKILNF